MLHTVNCCITFSVVTALVVCSCHKQITIYRFKETKWIVNSGHNSVYSLLWYRVYALAAVIMLFN